MGEPYGEEPVRLRGPRHRPAVTSVTCAAARLRAMSDHTERIAALVERVSAAKEFL
jgi:hypothetical protein